MESTGWRERLRAKLSESGRSMADISLAIGKSRNYLRSVLNDGNEPGLEGFVAICDALHVSPLWVLFGIDQGDDEQQQLFKAFAQMNAEQRRSFLNLAKTMQPAPKAPRS